jgi:hypothetical protein
MNKKYTIVNNSYDYGFWVDYFLFIIILILIIYLIIQYTYTNYNEYFINSNIPNATSCLTPSCSVEGEICPKGSLGASSTSLICKNGSWTKNNDDNINSEINGSLVITNSLNKSETPKNEILSVKQTITESQPLTIDQQLQEIKTENDILKMSKQTLEENIKKQSHALFLANNFYKIDNSSFNNQYSFINDDFKDIKLPENDFKNKVIIKTQKQWNDLLTQTNKFKNIYKSGDVVVQPSDYNISKDDICYKDYKTHISNDKDFKNKYPECMVCSVTNPDSDYKNTKSWKNTKTNIQKVCLFNPNASPNSTSLNYDGCKKLCNIK